MFGFACHGSGSKYSRCFRLGWLPTGEEIVQIAVICSIKFTLMFDLARIGVLMSILI